MGEFLRDYWLWIVAPLAALLIAVVLLVILFPSDGSSPFIYSLF